MQQDWITHIIAMDGTYFVPLPIGFGCGSGHGFSDRHLRADGRSHHQHVEEARWGQRHGDHLPGTRWHVGPIGLAALYRPVGLRIYSRILIAV